MVILKFFLFIDLLLVEEGVIYLDFCFVEFWCVELYDFGFGGIGGGVVDVFFGGRGGNFCFIFFLFIVD